MKISVMGTGYVGLVTGATLSEAGNDIVCLDIVEDKINQLNKGESPIFEPGLDKLIKKGIAKGNLKGSTNIEQGIVESDITFICVGTPSKKDGSIDLNYIKNASSAIGRALRHKQDVHTIIVKSTVIPQTTENVVLPIISKKSGRKRENIGIGMNPEFLREGSAVKDALKPDRIVIGHADEVALNVLKEIYKDHDCPKLECNPRTAEFIKYASNAFLATKISFANEMANMCSIWGIDFKEVAEGMGMDSRISPQFLQAGAGFGGSCFPKDVKALAAAAKSDKIGSKILTATLEVNESQPKIVIGMTKERLGVLKGKKIAILGLTFKPETDDVRESRTEIVVKELVDEGAKVIGHDPEGIENFKKIIDIETSNTLNEVVKGADCLILMTEWKEYLEMDLKSLKERMNGNVIIDGRRALNPEKVKEAGFDYKSIGLG